VNKKCRYILLGQTCHRGEDCRYSHDMSDFVPRRDCRYWVMGGCSQGSKCMFRHSGEAGAGLRRRRERRKRDRGDSGDERNENENENENENANENGEKHHRSKRNRDAEAEENE